MVRDNRILVTPIIQTRGTIQISHGMEIKQKETISIRGKCNRTNNTFKIIRPQLKRAI